MIAVAPAPVVSALFPGFQQVDRGPAGGQVWWGPIPGAKRPIMIYLPPRYDARRRYPVIFLLHGMPGSPWSYVASMHLARVADRVIRRGGRPFVAVVPAAGASGRYNGEWAGYWERWFVGEVVPWTKVHVRAGPLTIAGLSAGGYGAVDIALRHPGLFQAVESWGGYFTPYRDGPLVAAPLPELESHDPTLLLPRSAALLRRLRVRFFVSSGPGHGTVTPAATIRFARMLGALRISHALRLFPDARRRMWQVQLAAGLAYAFGNGKATSTSA